MAFAAAVVVIASAVSTAVAGLLQVKDIVGDFNLTAPLRHAKVVLPAPGAPQTLLLIGSDHRAGEPYGEAETDTMLLVRIDDKSSTINVLSIPRDLAVELPEGDGSDSEQKLNAAYSIGGPNLLISTLQRQVFPGLKVNHILDVNFSGFSDLVNAIGCVYTDVDHRYYNNTALTDYSSIDIQPGYQKLCGGSGSNLGGPNTALAFTRFRHTDSDIVRNARQQDFLRWTKDGYSTRQLLDNKSRLLKIFGAHVQTDKQLHSIDGLIDLFNLAVNANGHTVKSIAFPEYFGPCGTGTTPCFVVADSHHAESVAYRKFLTPTSDTSTTPKPQAKKKTPRASTAGLTADPGDGKSQAAQLGNVGLPIFYPELIQAGSQYCFAIAGNCDDSEEPSSEYEQSYPRKYVIGDKSGTPCPTYVMTIVINGALGEYYTVQGTTWRNPPILNQPHTDRVINGRKLSEYSDGGKLALIALHTRQGLYWIANTLANTIPNTEMVAIAASMRPAD